MNRRQRDANRATARAARWILHGSRQSFGGTAGSGSMVILSSSDFTRGSTARPTFVCYDDMEGSTALTVADLPVDLRSTIFGGCDEVPRTIPLLTEGEGDMLRVLEARWESTMNSLTGDGNAVFEHAASGSVWVAGACGTEGKVFEKRAVPLPITSDQWFADALDSLWMADSIGEQNSAIRLALSNRLSDHGWRGNPPPCWPESTRIAYCRTQGLPLNTPEETCRWLQRYGFLTSYTARNDAEQGEMETLRAALLAEGIDPGWEEVPRRATTDEDLAVFQIGKERPWHS